MFLSSPINFIVSRPVSELSGGSILSMPCTNMWEVSSIPCVDGGKYNIPCTSIPVGADSTCRFDISAMAHIPHGTIVSISDGKDVVLILFITELTSDNCVAINDDMSTQTIRIQEFMITALKVSLINNDIYISFSMRNNTELTRRKH